MHTVGFFHEQSRTDRDEFVQIMWDNIDRDSKDQFDKYTTRTINDLDLPYDYGSIMHYGPYAFTKNGKRTIQPLKSNTKLSKAKPSQRRSKPDLESAQSIVAMDSDFALHSPDITLHLHFALSDNFLHQPCFFRWWI